MEAAEAVNELSEEELIEDQDGLVYINDECGYQLTFPTTWKNWFAINREEKELFT